MAVHVANTFGRDIMTTTLHFRPDVAHFRPDIFRYMRDVAP
jgi:hypothetical protein